MKTEVHTPDETSLDDRDNHTQTSGARPTLRFERAGSEVKGDQRQATRRRHLAFKLTGRVPDDGLDSAASLVPVSLHPFLDVSGLRGNYPACTFDDPKQGIASLTELIDDTLSSLEISGDDAERTRRWTLQLEARIRKQAQGGGEDRLYKLWNSCLEDLSLQYADDPKKQEKLIESIAAVRGKIPGDGHLIPCDEQVALSLLKAVMRERQTDQTALQEVREVSRKLNDLLALEDEVSEEGMAPDHLKESVGDAFQADLDFESFSHLLHETPHVSTMSSRRRARIESVVAVLEKAVEAFEREKQSISTFSGTSAVLQHLAHRRADVATFSRAWVVAQLEVADRFDEDRHGSLLDPDSSINPFGSDASPLPSPIVHVDLRDGATAEDVGILQTLFELQADVRAVVSLGDLVNKEREPAPELLPVSMGEKLIAAAQGSGFLAQRSTSDLNGLVSDLRRFAASEGTAVMVVYDNGNVDNQRLHAYLRAAVAHEARVVPAFVLDSQKGSDWRSSFSIDGNEHPELVWPRSSTSVEGDDGELSLETSFSAASLMMCLPGFDDHFASLQRDEWHDDLVEFDAYSGSSGKIPFLWSATDEGVVTRVITTDHVWKAANVIARRWSMLRELGGVANSFAAQAVRDEKARLEAEYAERVEELESEHRTVLEKTTGRLAEEIVANIAAGLLGGSTVAPSLSEPRPRAPKTRVEVPAEEVAAAPLVEGPAEPEVEEDDLALFDEPYVETPRCTACDECTTLNPRLFAYNENKQAYIADASAGTFRELVLAAEKCPVRIIHPGKPLDPDEPHLDELLKRAEPFR